MKTKTIENYPCYVVGEDGNVYRRSDGHKMRGTVKRSGYVEVSLTNEYGTKGVLLHRIVAKAFCKGAGAGREVNHRDGNKLNNLPNNLEWISHGENLQHAYDTGLRAQNVAPRCVIATSIETGTKTVFSSIYRAARELKISQGNICMACKGMRPYAGGYYWQYAKGA